MGRCLTLAAGGWCAGARSADFEIAVGTRGSLIWASRASSWDQRAVDSAKPAVNDAEAASACGWCAGANEITSWPGIVRTPIAGRALPCSELSAAIAALAADASAGLPFRALSAIALGVLRIAGVLGWCAEFEHQAPLTVGSSP